MCDVWWKLVDWQVEIVTESEVGDAGRELERAVEERSYSKACDL